jgi:hypothetical protein
VPGVNLERSVLLGYLGKMKEQTGAVDSMASRQPPEYHRPCIKMHVVMPRPLMDLSGQTPEATMRQR